MSMWLTGTRSRARVEKGEQTPVVCPETCIGGIQVVFLQEVSLWLEGSCDQEEVFRYDSKFVQQETMGRRKFCYEKSWVRVREGIAGFRVRFLAWL
jgi:hypothetical protein